MIIEIFVFFFGLIWGSFLNVLALRLLQGQDWIFKRSHCPKCKKILPWYDLFPLFSWILLKGKCRFCKKTISWIYPVMELVTGIIAVLLYINVRSIYLPAYFIFFSALLVTIRTDLEDFVIFLIMTWGIVPIALLASLFKFLPITFTESILGIIVGYMSLWLVKKIYFILTKTEGLGTGDINLLATIGAFLGIQGVFTSIFLGSILGTIFGFILLIFYGTEKSSFRKLKIPFGVFLAIGAISHVFFINTKIIFDAIIN